MKRSFFLSVATPRVRGVLCMALSTAALFLATQGAWAACTGRPGLAAKVINMDMGKVTIPSDLAINAVIATRSFAIPMTGASEQLWDCPNGGILRGSILKGAALPGTPTIYSTSVPGVGIRLSVKFAAAQSFGNYPSTQVIRVSSGLYINAGGEFKVELIKTAVVTGNGPLSSGDYTSHEGDGDNKSMITSRLGGTGTTIVTPSCTVDAGSRNIPVNFGKVTTTSFRGRSSTAGDRDFNIRLNCSAGQNAQNTVQIKMDATADAANVDGVLRLTQAAGTNTAGGVGIQIVDATTKAAVKFGDTVDVGPSKDGSYVLPYTARYYQTGNTVTPGQANGTATFTLDYR